MSNVPGPGNLTGPQKSDARMRREFAGLNKLFKGGKTFQVNTGATVNVSVTDTLIVSTGDNGGGAHADVNLPAVDTVPDGHIITIKNADGLGTHGVNVDPNGSETIDGSTLTLLLGQYEWLTLVCADVDGSTREWLKIGSG